MLPSHSITGLIKRLTLMSVVIFLVSVQTGPRASAIGLKVELVTTGLSLPIFGISPEGDLDNLYICEGTDSRIKRVNLTTGQQTIMLNLPNTILGSQQGLYGLAFHPEYANNGKIYINYSNNTGVIRILEYTLSESNPNAFDPASEREVLLISNPSNSHNGGWLGFGPHDDYLYVATGDGGNVPPQETKGLPAQDLNSLQGKILRIDVDGDDFPGDASRNYAIPSTNPFAAGGGAPEVFAWGLRHPFRNSFDRDTGDLYIGDVGSQYYEEVNFLPAGNGGQNFGWRPREGFFDNPAFPDPTPPGAIDPIYAYPRGVTGAVIGGYVYRGDEIPWLDGTYFLNDYETTTLTSFRYDGNQVTEVVDRTAELDSPLGYGGIASFAEDAAGELYILNYAGGGALYKIVAAPPEDYGDFNADGTVDAADYPAWRANDGTQAGYDAWLEHFGQSVSSGAAPGPFVNSSRTAPVPEPAGLVLALLGGIMGLAVRRR